MFLDKYTEYRIQVLAFNPAGDGPRTPSITVRTKQVHEFKNSETEVTELFSRLFFFPSRQNIFN